MTYPHLPQGTGRMRLLLLLFVPYPLARGSSRSGSIASLVKTAQEIADTGVHEIVLTGVNTGDFGIQNGNEPRRLST